VSCTSDHAAERLLLRRDEGPMQKPLDPDRSGDDAEARRCRPGRCWRSDSRGSERVASALLEFDHGVGAYAQGSTRSCIRRQPAALLSAEGTSHTIAGGHPVGIRKRVLPAVGPPGRATPDLIAQLGVVAVGGLALGGVLYTAGGVIYARQRPDPRPAVFGYHEAFHLLVLIAGSLQYTVVAFWVV
jgi:Haemolysin-III related